MYTILRIFVNIVYFISLFNKNLSLKYMYTKKYMMEYLQKLIKLKLIFCEDFMLLIRYINLN